MFYCSSVAEDTTDPFVLVRFKALCTWPWSLFPEDDRMTYIPRQQVTQIIPNKFEAIKIAALEARRLNERARMYNVSLPGKITSLARVRPPPSMATRNSLKERARQARLEREQEGEE